MHPLCGVCTDTNIICMGKCDCILYYTDIVILYYAKITIIVIMDNVIIFSLYDIITASLVRKRIHT
jgi:hypothetical protein